MVPRISSTSCAEFRNMEFSSLGSARVNVPTYTILRQRRTKRFQRHAVQNKHYSENNKREGGQIMPSLKENTMYVYRTKQEVEE
jgi:hypothetical protein